MKKLISLLLALSLLFCMTSPVIAASDEATNAANILNKLGLFNGVGTNDNGTPNYDLDRTPTRIEALVMLIRLLGQEQTVLNGKWQHPFNDVPTWADKYIGYAYENELTTGVSAVEFGTGNATAAMYLTFVLRSLGYSDKNNEDFTWSSPFTLSRLVGILNDSIDSNNFLRADVVQVSCLALNAQLKNSDITLAEKLIDDGVFSTSQYEAAYNASQNDSVATAITLNRQYAYIGEGEEIKLEVESFPKGSNPQISWTSDSPEFKVDNGLVTVAYSGGAASVITATADNGLSASCYVMMKSNEIVTQQVGQKTVYSRFPAILSFENVSPNTPLWTYYDISYPQFDIYNYGYSYLISDLPKAEELAKEYARWLQNNDYLLVREEDDPLHTGSVGNDIVYELRDPTNKYSVEIKGTYPAIGGSRITPEVSVSIDYSDATLNNAPLVDNEVTPESVAVAMYKRYKDVPDFGSVCGEEPLIDNGHSKVYTSSLLVNYISVLEQYGYKKSDNYTETYANSQLLTQYGKISIYKNSDGRELHILEIQDSKTATTFVFVSIDTEIKKPLISEAISTIVAQQNPYEDDSCPYKKDRNNYKYGNTDTIYGSPIYVRKAKVDSIKDLQTFLNTKYETIFSPMEDLKVDIEIWDNSTSSAGQLFNIHVEFSYVSSDYDVITPYNFASKYGYTEKQKEETRQMIKEMLHEISQDAIDCFPDATVSGSIFVDGYHYPHIKVDYYWDQTLTWNRTADNFVWVPSLDTFSLYE